MPSEITIRLSQSAKDQLAWLKRHTGLTQWNELCRWALALSLRDPSTPLVRDITTDSNVEIAWKTFAGPHGDVYLALLKQRCAMDGEEPTDTAAPGGDSRRAGLAEVRKPADGLRLQAARRQQPVAAAR